VILRLADPSDADEIAEIGALTVDAYLADGYLGGAEDGYADHLRAAADRARDAELAVAVDEGSGAVLGTVTYCRAGTPWAEVSGDGEAECRMLAVAPTARGRGVGEALATWCVDRARADGCRAVVLSTLPVMHPAHRIYQRLGFVRTPERDWYPQPDIQLITYQLEL
jgi:ribosomal protein S18 acetylase RimI-like enzyme